MCFKKCFVLIYPMFLHAFKVVICIKPQRGKHQVMNLHTVLFRLSVWRVVFMEWFLLLLKACREFMPPYRTCHRTEPVSDPGVFLAAGVGFQWRSFWLTLCAWSYSSLIENEYSESTCFSYFFHTNGYLEYHNFSKDTNSLAVGMFFFFLINEEFTTTGQLRECDHKCINWYFEELYVIV